MNELTTAVSLEEWVAKVGTWKTATRELVRLWLVNELGCQKELANHLGLSDRAIRKHVAKLRDDGELPQVAETDGRAKGQKKEPSSYSVEQRSAPAPIAAYPSAVVPPLEHDEEPPPLPTAEELMARVLNLEAENASLRALLEAQPADEEGSVRIHNPSGESFDRIETLIEDIEDIHRELFEGGLSEGQWQDLLQQYHSLQYFADIRWQNRRRELEQRREKFDGILEDAKARFDGAVIDGAVSSMGTADQRGIDADWAEASALLNGLEKFSKKYFDPQKGLSERRYEELWSRCDGLAYFAHMRFADQRKEDAQVARQITNHVLASEGLQPVADAVIDGAVTSIGTADDRRADEDFAEVTGIIDRINEIQEGIQPGTWSDHQWLNLTELYCTMHSIAEGYSRN